MRHVVTRDRPHLGGRARVDVGRLGRRLDRGRRVEEVADAAERLEQQPVDARWQCKVDPWC